MTGFSNEDAGQRTEVAPDKIEAALSERWRKLAEAATLAHGRPVTRAVLWNVILTGAPEVTRKLVDELVSESPTRAIVLAEPTEGDGLLHAYVETNIAKHGDGSIGADEVTLEVGGQGDTAKQSLSQIPSVVRSLLVPDSKTALAWIGAPPPADHVSRGLVGEIDRLILDTRRLSPEDGDRGLETLLALSHRHQRLEVADLAWLGISPLRGLCAALFDPPCDPGPLAELDEVVVTSGVPGVQARALLMLGWLGSRLGWKEAASMPGDLRSFSVARADGGRVMLRIAVDEGGARHGVRKLELVSRDRRWSLERDNEKIEVHAPGLPVRAQPARSHTLVERVGEALGRKGRDRNYHDALRFAVGLVRAERRS